MGMIMDAIKPSPHHLVRTRKSENHVRAMFKKGWYIVVVGGWMGGGVVLVIGWVIFIFLGAFLNQERGEPLMAVIHTCFPCRVVVQSNKSVINTLSPKGPTHSFIPNLTFLSFFLSLIKRFRSV